MSFKLPTQTTISSSHHLIWFATLINWCTAIDDYQHMALSAPLIGDLYTGSKLRLTSSLRRWLSDVGFLSCGRYVCLITLLHLLRKPRKIWSIVYTTKDLSAKLTICRYPFETDDIGHENAKEGFYHHTYSFLLENTSMCLIRLHLFRELTVFCFILTFWIEHFRTRCGASAPILRIK